MSTCSTRNLYVSLRRLRVELARAGGRSHLPRPELMYAFPPPLSLALSLPLSQDEMALVRRVNRPIFTSPSESTAHTELNHIVNVAPNAPPNLTDMLAAQRLGHLPHFYRPESTYEFQQDGDGWPAGRGMRQGWGGYEAMDTEEEEGAGPSGSQGGSQIWYPNQPDTDFTGSLYPFPGFDTRSSAPTSAPSPPHSTSSPLLNLPPTFSPLERAPSPSPDRPPSVALPAVAGPSSVNEDHCGHCGRETMDETSQRHWAETMWVCGSCSKSLSLPLVGSHEHDSLLTQFALQNYTSTCTGPCLPLGNGRRVDGRLTSPGGQRYRA